MASHCMLNLVADEGHECHRATARHRVLLSAKLITTTDEFCVRLRDLSATGAKVEGEKLPPAGKDVILKRGRLEVFATIVWSSESQGGLAFDEPLSEGEVLAQASHQAVVPPPPEPEVYKRPGFRSGRLTPEELALAESWARPAAPQAFGE